MAIIVETKSILNKWITDSRNTIVANARKQGRVATGETERNTYSQVNEEGPSLKGKIVAPSHARYGWEDGRRPGGLPPISALQRWIKAKGLDMNAWALQKSIAKKGTKLYQEGGNSGVITDVANQQRVDELKAQLAREWARVYTTNLFTSFGNGTNT